MTDQDTRGTRRWWDDLSDGELKSRLVERGVGLTASAALVRDREANYAGGLIDRHLGAK